VTRNWVGWHDAYDDPASGLSTRLALVQGHLSDALDAAPDGPIRVLSLCAGQGRDVIGVLASHPRRDDVTALLVELDPANAEIARNRAGSAGLLGVTVRQADAGIVASYADALPADVLLLCGIFGNVNDEDIHRTVTAARALCAPGGTVIWTRHRRAPDLTGDIRSWFAAAGFQEVAFDTPETTTLTGVGVHRRPSEAPTEVTATAATELPPDGRLFTFRPDRQAGPSPAPPSRPTTSPPSFPGLGFRAP
jgi:predicted RNA methylase